MADPTGAEVVTNFNGAAEQATKIMKEFSISIDDAVKNLPNMTVMMHSVESMVKTASITGKG